MQAPAAGDALVIVDVQRDFLPGGALAVPQGDQIVPVLNRYLELFNSRHLPVFATRDWHPANHGSFRSQGGRWPIHCVQGSAGAQFSPRLNLPPDAIVVSKATLTEHDLFSGFDRTDFDERLRERQVRRLWIGGLATEYCVLATVRDALAQGYQVRLAADAIAALDVEPGDGTRAIAEMVRRGAVLVRWEETA